MKKIQYGNDCLDIISSIEDSWIQSFFDECLPKNPFANNLEKLISSAQKLIKFMQIFTWFIINVNVLENLESIDRKQFSLSP